MEEDRDRRRGAGYVPSIHSGVYAGLFDPGGQWMEARGSTRVLGGNPWAQEVLVRHLVGIYQTAIEGWEPCVSISSADSVPNDVAAEALKTVIRYLRERYPDWASLEPVELDPDLGLMDYPGANPHVKSYVEEVILDGNFSRSNIK